MAKTDLTIPSLGNKFIDLRDILPGDAYNFSWERQLSQVNYLAIHHTGGADSQTPQEIANEHITKNGWGGIGYHFLIDKDGFVYYVGDISTARANVANLNEQVIGIGLIGNFVAFQVPTEQQLVATHLLCEFLLNYPDLVNVRSWDKVRGHKELPDQLTPCPGDDWSNWRIKIVEGGSDLAKLTDEDDFQIADLKTQISNLQTSLASVNQQAISLRLNLQDREQEINELKKAADKSLPYALPLKKVDESLTIVQALINLYKFVLPPRKE